MELQDQVVYFDRDGKPEHRFFTARLRRDLRLREGRRKRRPGRREANIRLRDENIRIFLERSKNHGKEKE